MSRRRPMQRYRVDGMAERLREVAMQCAAGHHPRTRWYDEDDRLVLRCLACSEAVRQPVATTEPTVAEG